MSKVVEEVILLAERARMSEEVKKPKWTPSRCDDTGCEVFIVMCAAGPSLPWLAFKVSILIVELELF